MTIQHTFYNGDIVFDALSRAGGGISTSLIDLTVDTNVRAASISHQVYRCPTSF